jgi:hypothetical protein
MKGVYSVKNKWRIALLILFAVSVLINISGCSKTSIPSQKKNSLSQNQTQNNTISPPGNESNANNAGSNLSANDIPFSYAFTGFIVVNNVQEDLPIGTELINTESAWTKFENKYLSDMAYSEYYAEPIDFNKQSVIYFSMLDAKADVYATASQIKDILIKNNQLVVNVEPIGNLHIIVVNRESASHRYVIVVTVNKNSLPSDLQAKETYFNEEQSSASP